MILRQYDLESEGKEYDDFRVNTCWLEEGRVKVGDSVTLKDTDEPERLWTVVKEYSAIDSKKINRGWNNNI